MPVTTRRAKLTEPTINSEQIYSSLQKKKRTANNNPSRKRKIFDTDETNSPLKCRKTRSRIIMESDSEGEEISDSMSRNVISVSTSQSEMSDTMSQNEISDAMSQNENINDVSTIIEQRNREIDETMRVLNESLGNLIESEETNDETNNDQTDRNSIVVDLSLIHI